LLKRLIAHTYAQWNTDDGWLYAAAIAAFAALALAPLLVVTLRIAEAIGGEPLVLHALALIIDPIVGHGGVRSLSAIAAHGQSSAGFVPTLFAVAIALFAGSRLFYALQRALHLMWNTPRAQTASLMHTLASFLTAGFLSIFVMAGMTVLIFGSAALVDAAHGAGVRGFPASAATRIGGALLGAIVLTPVVAALFRWLGRGRLAWGDVWIGAITTSIGFALAQVAIGIYLAFVNLPWTYGSAASLIVILLWLYYSAYVFLLGAEFTAVYAREMGSLRGFAPIGTFGEKGPRTAEATPVPGGRSEHG
jgi:membrane protein